MKKSLVALAALAVAGVASAQSSVTLFGIVDAGVSYYQLNSKSTVPGVANMEQSKWALSTSGNATSRLGFRGTEDLGGGLAASFWLEGQLFNDDGNAAGLDFMRRSTVSLSGNFGEVRLGRDFTPTFWNDTNFDPFGTNGVGSSLIHSFGGNGTSMGGQIDGNYVRSSNSVGYFLPSNLGGFYGQVMYGFDENVDSGGPTTSAGRYIGGRAGYANGPLDVALAYGQSTITALGESDIERANLGVSYDFGVVKLFGEYSHVDLSAGIPVVGDQSYEGYLLGATVPVGPGLIKASYSHVNGNRVGGDPKADKFALGYVHNLSKRTALYATFAYVKNKNGVGAGFPSDSSGPNSLSTFGAGNVGNQVADKAYGYDFGIRHSF